MNTTIGCKERSSMYLPDFDYLSPRAVNEACGVLAQFREQAKVLAGGTDLLPQVKN